MSGPVDKTGMSASDLGAATIEVKPGRETQIGETRILRVLPTKRRRTVGPWCFVDLMKPDDVTDPPPLEIGPHPHIGLATVTWLFAGEVLHSDSLGSHQLIRPGELNLMTAGHGIAHAEEGTRAGVAADTGGIMGAQMWLAQTDSTRHGSSAFQHLAELPILELDQATARILIGEMGGVPSPAVVDHATVGLDIAMRQATIVPIRPEFEYAVVPIDRPLKVEDVVTEPGALALVPMGYDHLRIETRQGPGRVLVLGGEPLGTEIKMWWNFVARTFDEITAAWRAWQDHDDDRFGPVDSSLRRIDAPPPPWLGTPDATS